MVKDENGSNYSNWWLVRVTLVVHFAFFAQNFSPWWGSINDICHSVNVDWGIGSGLPRVRETSGENTFFSRSGNFKKMSGNFGYLTHVRELSGNFVMSCQGILS